MNNRFTLLAVSMLVACAAVSPGRSRTDFVGVPASEVVRAVGIPQECSTSAHTIYWQYRGVDGVPATILFQQGRAIAGASAADIVPGPAPGDVPYVGQSARDLADSLGRPDETRAGTASLTLLFRDYEIGMSQGIVVGVSRRK